jgi:hypothetical protein
MPESTARERADEHRWDVRATVPAIFDLTETVRYWPLQGRKADARKLARELREAGYEDVEVVDGWAD